MTKTRFEARGLSPIEVPITVALVAVLATVALPAPSNVGGVHG